MTGPMLWNEDAEQAVLSAMLFDTAAPLAAAELLEPSAFLRDGHRVLFEVMVALAQSGGTINPVSLRDELLRRGQLERVGGLEYLADIIDVVPTATNLAAHAGLVRDYAIRRQLAIDAQQAAALAQDLSQPVTTSLEHFVDRLVAVATPSVRPPELTLRAELNEVLDDIERQTRVGGGVRGVGTGIERLDALTEGWVPGRLVVVAARPKQGKTGFALHCARAACRANVRTYFATAEQPRKELLKRLVAMESGTHLRTITSPTDLDRDVASLARAANEIASWPLLVEQSARTPSAVRLSVLRQRAEHGAVGLVVVDYLGKFRSGQKSERHDLEIGKMTGAFADIAIDLNVPVLLLAQLNRDSVRGGQVRRPTVSDLRDSGSIEQDAAQVLFLYRDERADQAARDPHWLEIIVELNRFGPTGSAEARFEKQTGRWLQPLHLAGGTPHEHGDTHKVEHAHD